MHAASSETDILASIVSSSNDAIIGKNLDGIVTSWNEAAERLFGFSAMDMIGQPILRIIPQNRIEEERIILRQAIAGDHLTHFETERVTKDGRSIPVS
jgi:two-component system sensor histidine kinase VicK